MAEIRLDSKGSPVPGEHWLTVMLLGSGYAAVEMWMCDCEPDLGPFPEPYNTGFGRYRTRRDAELEAEQWSESDELPIWPPFSPIKETTDGTS